jgi:hypothetical protein
LPASKTRRGADCTVISGAVQGRVTLQAHFGVLRTSGRDNAVCTPGDDPARLCRPGCRLLEHWHFDTFRVRFDTPVLPAVPVTFRLNAAGKVAEVELDMAGVAVFRRNPEPGAAGSR